MPPCSNAIADSAIEKWLHREPGKVHGNLLHHIDDLPREVKWRRAKEKLNAPDSPRVEE